MGRHYLWSERSLRPQFKSTDQAFASLSDLAGDKYCRRVSGVRSSFQEPLLLRRGGRRDRARLSLLPSARAACFYLSFVYAFMLDIFEQRASSVNTLVSAWENKRPSDFALFLTDPCKLWKEGYKQNSGTGNVRALRTLAGRTKTVMSLSVLHFHTWRIASQFFILSPL